MSRSGDMGTTNTYVKYYIEAYQNWQDIGQNYTSLKVKVWAYRTNSGYTTYGSGTCYVSCNGGNYSSSINSGHKITSNPIVLFEQDINVWHNADGTKNCGFSARIQHNVFSSNDQYWNMDLNRIPRTSNATISSTWFHINSGLTIWTNRASTAFTHTIWEDFGLGWWREIASGVTDNWTWVPGYDLASRMPNSTSLGGRIRVATYSGGTYIGEVVRDTSFYINNGECVPYWEGTPYYNIDLQGMPAGHVVKGKNQVRAICDPRGSYGSSIRRIAVNFWNQRIEGASDSWSPRPDRWGNQYIWWEAQDSRGRMIYHNVQLYIDDWWEPWARIEGQPFRCTSTGVAKDDGDYISFRARADCPNLSGMPNHTFEMSYRIAGSTWKSVYNVTNAITYDKTIIVEGSTELSFEFKVDYNFQGDHKIANATLGSAFVLMDFHNSGKAVGFGAVSANPGYMDIALTPFIKPNSVPGMQGIMDLKFAPCGKRGWEMSIFGHNATTHPTASSVFGLYNNSLGQYIQQYEHDSSYFGGDHHMTFNTPVLFWNRVALMNALSFSTGGEQSITKDNNATYAFWNESNAGYWDTTHGQVWNFSGNLFLRPGYQTGSDIRLKHDISYMSNPNERFMSFTDNEPMKMDYRRIHSKLKPSVFKINQENNEKFHFGFIAQDLQAMLIEEGILDSALVSETEMRVSAPEYDKDSNLIKDEATVTRLTISQQDLIALNTFVIQEQQKELDIANTKIEDLSNKYAELESKLNLILSKMN